MNDRHADVPHKDWTGADNHVRIEKNRDHRTVCEVPLCKGRIHTRSGIASILFRPSERSAHYRPMEKQRVMVCPKGHIVLRKDGGPAYVADPRQALELERYAIKLTEQHWALMGEVEDLKRQVESYRHHPRQHVIDEQAVRIAELEAEAQGLRRQLAQRPVLPRNSIDILMAEAEEIQRQANARAHDQTFFADVLDSAIHHAHDLEECEERRAS